MRKFVRIGLFSAVGVLLAAVIPAAGLQAAPGPGDEGDRRETVRIVIDDDGDRNDEVFEFDADHPRPFLGVMLEGTSEAGIRVTRVVENSGADRAGLQKDDLITAIDGTQVDDSWDLTRQVLRGAPGDRVTLDLLRDGQQISLTAELGEHEHGKHLGRHGLKLEQIGEHLEQLGEHLHDLDIQVDLADLHDDLRLGRFHRPVLGVALVQPTPELREHLGAPVDAGVLVSKLVSGMPAEDGGVEVGDLIVSAAGEPIADHDDLVRALRDHDGEILELGLVRDGRSLAVDVALPLREEERDD